LRHEALAALSLAPARLGSFPRYFSATLSGEFRSSRLAALQPATTPQLDGQGIADIFRLRLTLAGSLFHNELSELVYVAGSFA
jgi:hypothetical protein